jgi:hypothetical protein
MWKHSEASVPEAMRKRKTQALYPAGAHLVGYTGFALGLPMVGAKILDRDQRQRQHTGMQVTK